MNLPARRKSRNWRTSQSTSNPSSQKKEHKIDTSEDGSKNLHNRVFPPQIIQMMTRFRPSTNLPNNWRTCCSSWNPMTGRSAMRPWTSSEESSSTILTSSLCPHWRQPFPISWKWQKAWDPLSAKMHWWFLMNLAQKWRNYWIHNSTLSFLNWSKRASIQIPSFLNRSNVH